MLQITRVTFDLMPADGAGNGFLTPHAYIFRGILMNWLQNYKHEIGDQLHQKQPKDTPLYYGNYSIQRRFLYMTPQGLSEKRPRFQDEDEANRTEHQRDRRPFRKQSQPYKSREEIQGIRFVVNMFTTELGNALFELLLNQKDHIVQFGPQQAIIAGIQLERISALTLMQQTCPIHAIEMQFLTPTEFSSMGQNNPLRFPLPERVFGYLYKFWNAHFLDAPAWQIPTDFYEWCQKHVTATSYELKTVPWEMGERKKAAGFKGWVKFVVDDDNPIFARWLHVLCRLGEYTSIGNSRSAGLGQFIIRDMEMGQEPPANMVEILGINLA
jgi:CRISPR-associated endoribonuclease Cas6